MLAHAPSVLVSGVHVALAHRGIVILACATVGLAAAGLWECAYSRSCTCHITTVACTCPRMARPQPPPTSVTEVPGGKREDLRVHTLQDGLAVHCPAPPSQTQQKHELTLNCGPTEHRLFHRPLKAGSVAVHEAARRRVE